jgi:hypothetical protein
MRARWRCPNAGHDEPQPGAAHPDPACAAALDGVARMTGVRCETCPHWHTSRPWVLRAANARRWRDKGQLQLRARTVSAALADAIDAIDAGVTAREDYDHRRREEERAAREDAAPKARTHE